MHLGGTRILLHTVTMDDVQGVDFLQRVQPAHAIPVHHSDYGVFRSPLAGFVNRASAAGWGERLITVEAGDTVPLPARAE